jgi:tetratricopeptide (TPR) repeat protein
LYNKLLFAFAAIGAVFGGRGFAPVSNSLDDSRRVCVSISKIHVNNSGCFGWAKRARPESSAPQRLQYASVRVKVMKWIRVVSIALFFLGMSACIFLREDVRLVDRGYESLLEGAVGEAEQLFEAALEANPDNLYAMLNLGVIYASTGRERLAREMYRKVIENDTSNSIYPVRVGEDDMKGKTLKEIAETNLGRMN